MTETFGEMIQKLSIVLELRIRSDSCKSCLLCFHISRTNRPLACPTYLSTPSSPTVKGRSDSDVMDGIIDQPSLVYLKYPPLHSFDK